MPRADKVLIFWVLVALVIIVTWGVATAWDGRNITPAQADRQAQRGAQQQLTEPPPAPATTTTFPSYLWPWDDLQDCESSYLGWTANTGNGFYGGLQFTLQSWRGVGGTGYPHQHSRAEQIRRGIALQKIQGWGAWPACSRKLGLR
jgi:hypothetical protein